MKKILYILLTILIFLPSTISAATFRSSETNATVGEEERLENAYLAGNSITTEGRIEEDVLGAGNIININSVVGGSAMLAGNTILVGGSIGNSVRAAGNIIVIESEVDSDVLAAGNTITLTEASRVGDDFVAAGSAINLDGLIGGRAMLTGAQININGIIDGDVVIREAGKVSIGENARINGDLTYSASEPATIAEGAQIAGEVNFQEIKRANGGFNFSEIASGLFLGWLLVTYIVLLLVIYLLPKFSRSVVEYGFAKPGERMGIGFIYLVVVPIAAILLMLTVIGIPFGLVALGIYGVTIFIARVLTALLVGAYIVYWISRNKKIRVDWFSALVGVLVVALIGLIPVIGWLAIFLVFLIVLARFADWQIQFLRKSR